MKKIKRMHTKQLNKIIGGGNRGNRGANGVVVINTKQGAKNSGLLKTNAENNEH